MKKLTQLSMFWHFQAILTIFIAYFINQKQKHNIKIDTYRKNYLHNFKVLRSKQG